MTEEDIKTGKKLVIPALLLCCDSAPPPEHASMHRRRCRGVFTSPLFASLLQLEEDFVKANPEWVAELELMLKTKEKAEIQALSSFGFQYLSQVRGMATIIMPLHG